MLQIQAKRNHIIKQTKEMKGIKKNTQMKSHRHEGDNGGVRLLKKLEENKKVVAVIVTFVNGSSYDHLFTSVEQQAEEGTQVLVYAASSSSVGQILEGFQQESKVAIIKQMVEQIKSLDSDCVVFNWECCSGYSNKHFSEGPAVVYKFIDAMLKRNHMLMFSDFSLKALISSWDQEVLGPNPFVQVTQFGGNFQLSFECNTLRDCPSAQLQIIGQMAGQGHCNVQAAGGTIVYTVKKEHKNQIYDLQILTVASSLNIDKNHQCQVSGKKGAAGHVLLKFKKGGMILTSMGHWVQLMKIDTSEKALFEVAEREYGAEYASSMRKQYEGMDEIKKKAYISKNSIQFVQRQAPCTNMARKKR